MNHFIISSLLIMLADKEFRPKNKKGGNARLEFDLFSLAYSEMILRVALFEH